MSQVHGPRSLHFNKQNRRFWWRWSGGHTSRNPGFRLSSILGSKVMDQMNSQVYSSLMIPIFPPFILCLSILCPLVLLTLVALVSYDCLLSLTFTTNSLALSLPMHCLSATEESNRIISTFDRWILYVSLMKPTPNTNRIASTPLYHPLVCPHP